MWTTLAQRCSLQIKTWIETRCILRKPSGPENPRQVGQRVEGNKPVIFRSNSLSSFILLGPENAAVIDPSSWLVSSFWTRLNKTMSMWGRCLPHLRLCEWDCRSLLSIASGNLSAQSWYSCFLQQQNGELVPKTDVTIQPCVKFHVIPSQGESRQGREFANVLHYKVVFFSVLLQYHSQLCLEFLVALA